MTADLNENSEYTDADADFSYCEICRHNFNNGKKHFYTSKHTSSLERILKNMSKKIVECNQEIKKPKLCKSKEVGTFWCYFCCNEYKRGKNVNLYFLADHDLMIEHFSSPEHRHSCIEFFRKNRVNRDQNAIESYIIQKDDLLLYKDRLKVEIERQQENVQNEIKLEAQKIRQQEQNRVSVLYWANKRKTDDEENQNNASNTKHPKLDSEIISIRGEDMTFVGRTKSNQISNIFTGAKPPWLLAAAAADNNSNTTSNVIGPTIDDLKNHKQEEWHRKLPETRLGGKNSHAAAATNWMPKYSTAWSKKRPK